MRTEGLGGKAAASVPIEIYTEETQDAYVTYAKEKNLWVKETVPKEADAAPLDMAAVKDLMTRSIRSAHVLSQDGGKEVILFRMDALEPFGERLPAKASSNILVDRKTPCLTSIKNASLTLGAAKLPRYDR
mgnify:FL=1